MAVRPIVVWPDARLREPTQAVTEVNDDLRALYRDLVDTMYAHNGLGIAAIQIGVPLKMFLVEPVLAGGEASDKPLAFMNPEVVSVSDEFDRADEGCLSFPGIYVPVDRPFRATMRAMNMDGETFEVTGEELYARCLLHENDHLTGKILIDFVGPLKKQMIKRKLKRASEETAHG